MTRKKYEKFEGKRIRQKKTLLFQTDEKQVHLISERSPKELHQPSPKIVENNDDVIEVEGENDDVLDDSFWTWLEDRLTCDFCDRTFATIEGKERHLETHLKILINPGKTECQPCYEVESSDEESAIEIEEDEVKCETCGRCF